MLDTLRPAIDQELTDRRRQAPVALLMSRMPFEEVARRTGANGNALHKLLHDARKRLKARPEATSTPYHDMVAASGSKRKA